MARIGSATPAPPILDILEDYIINQVNTGCGLSYLGSSVQGALATAATGLVPTASAGTSLEILANGLPAWRCISTVAGVARAGYLLYQIPLLQDLLSAPIVPGTTALSRLYRWDTVWWREAPITTGVAWHGIYTTNNPPTGLNAGAFNAGILLQADPAVNGGNLQLIRKLTNAAVAPTVVLSTAIDPSTPRKYTWEFQTTSSGRKLTISAEGAGTIYQTTNAADFPTAAAGIPSQGINVYGLGWGVKGVIGDVIRVTGQRLRIENLT